jgi:methionyl-tRNA formyltransferase
LLDAPGAAGVTIHTLADTFDTGDILAQAPITVDAGEDLDSLTAKIIIAAPPLLSNVLADPENYWTAAEPQDETRASHWPPPEGQIRTLDWTQDIAAITRKHRAFGSAMVRAEVDRTPIWVESLSAWQEEHSLSPGEIAARYEDQLVIAAQDGLVVLKRWYQAE